MQCCFMAGIAFRANFLEIGYSVKSRSREIFIEIESRDAKSDVTTTSYKSGKWYRPLACIVKRDKNKSICVHLVLG